MKSRKMQHEYSRKGMHIGYWWESQKERTTGKRKS
jgi:hypothetical protein